MDKSKSESNKFIYDKKTWNVLDEYFKSNRLTLHQINSYNDFIDTLIPKTLSEISPIKQYWNFDTELNRYRKEINITLFNPCMSKPIINENDGTQKPMYPIAARLRKLTYSGSLTCDVKSEVFTYEKNERKLSSTYEHKGVILGKIPIMLGSNYCILKNISNITKQELGECIYDLGGYFIVIGNEKVIIPQEILSANKIYIFKSNKNLGKVLREARVTSIPEENSTIIKPTIIKLINADNRYGITFKVNVKRFKVDIPLFILFRALGVLTDKAIVKYIVGDINEDTNNIVSYLDSSIEESMYIKTKELAIDYVGKQSTIKFDYVKNQSLSDENKYTYIQDILLEDLFPHLGRNSVKKAYFLGYMVKKLILVDIGILPSDDRDSFLNKKVETTGQLLNSLFRINLNKVTKDIKSSIDKDIKSGRIDDLVENVYKKIKPGTIELGIKYGLATGNWGIQQKAVRQGIAIMLNRLSYAAYLSFMRKINAPLEKTLKAVDPRFLHNTQHGTICPSETPEGSGVGIIKNMALTTNITINSSPELLYNILEEYGVIYIENCIPEQIYNNIKVFINGDFVGITDDPNNLMIKLRTARRSGIINIFTSLSWNICVYEIRCDTSAGRLCRPLYIVENNELLMNNDIADRIKKCELTWNDLICDKNYTHDVKKYTTCVIEYLDISEINTMMIAMTYNDIVNNKKDNKIFVNYTHCELHPSMMYGAVVSCSPFVNHNQAARNQFQGSMGTQAIGLSSTNYLRTINIYQHVLYYPQRPLISTRPSRYLNADKMPSGINAIVAIMCYTGYNQEDSLIFNKSSIERGLFISSHYRKYEATEQKNQVTLAEERFCKPEKFNLDGSVKTQEIKPASYDKLDEETGLVKEGEYVTEKDIIIGKVIPLKTGDGTAQFKDSSVSIKTNESGYVDRVYTNKDSDNYTFCKVKLRTEKIPEIGDKFASRHAQKGTIGMTYRSEDMPYTKDGVVPDIIMNPHALPSRMTIGQLLECILGKVCLFKGCYGDATAFNGTKVKDIGEELEKYGFSKAGTEVLYNGKTGEQIATKIFIGPTYYQRLKHLVADKVHSRGTGPYNLMTRQPAEGRSREGGLRIGEMERDCLLSHGITSFLNERLFECSDKFMVYVCDICGHIAIANSEKNIYHCRYCNNYKYFSRIRLPYSCKLFFQELQSMGIIIKIQTDKFIGNK